jgi:hypothetical protein
MTRYLIGSTFVAALFLNLAAPANASVAYTFHKTASNPANLPISIGMTFANAGSAMAGNAFGGGFTGLLGFQFRLGTVEVDLQDLMDIQQRCAPPAQNPSCQPFTLSYDLSPDDGFLRFNNQSFDFAFAYADAVLAGSFNSDGPSAPGCQQTGNCRYLGNWHPIPEPLAAGLLAAGLAGVALARARRKRAGLART